MWSLIPQVFYDFLARVVPGGILILLAILVRFGPEPAISVLFESSISLVFLGLVTLVSYVVGLLLGDAWDWTIGRALRNRYRKRETRYAARCLQEHQDLQRALGGDDLRVTAKTLPRAFVMRDHLRLAAPAEVARLLKLKAERRLCNVLTLGCGMLTIPNAYALALSFSLDRLFLAVVLLIMMTLCSYREYRLFAHYVNGTTVMWLVHASLNKLPLATGPR